MTQATTTVPLSRELRESTAHVHELAENAGFMSRLLAGGVELSAVADYTGQLWFIYTALEGAIRRASSHQHLAPLHDPRLERVGALESDLDSLVGDGWRGRLEMLPATAEYVTHLESLGAENGVEVLAHHYVRYLGDVSGGQAVARMLIRHYSLDGECLSFYDFSVLGKIKPFRDGYRETLDGLEMGEAEKRRLLAEAVRAFGFNTAVFKELGARY